MHEQLQDNEPEKILTEEALADMVRNQIGQVCINLWFTNLPKENELIRIYNTLTGIEMNMSYSRFTYLAFSHMQEIPDGSTRKIETVYVQEHQSEHNASFDIYTYPGGGKFDPSKLAKALYHPVYANQNKKISPRAAQLLFSKKLIEKTKEPSFARKEIICEPSSGQTKYITVQRTIDVPWQIPIQILLYRDAYGKINSNQGYADLQQQQILEKTVVLALREVFKGDPIDNSKIRKLTIHPYLCSSSTYTSVSELVFFEKERQFGPELFQNLKTLSSQSLMKNRQGINFSIISLLPDHGLSSKEEWQKKTILYNTIKEMSTLGILPIILQQRNNLLDLSSMQDAIIVQANETTLYKAIQNLYDRLEEILHHE